MSFLILQVPGLAVIVVGTRGDAMTYAKLKRKACEEVGIVCFEKYLPATSSEADVIRTVRSYNRNSKVHGVVLQLPVTIIFLDLLSCERHCGDMHLLDAAYKRDI